MKSIRNRFVLPLIAVALLGALLAPRHSPAQQQVASVEQLKSEAFKALRTGQFDRTNELLARAATLSADPTLAQMSGWLKAFETQRQGFLADRRKEYDKEVANIHLLLKNGKTGFALDHAARAYLLAVDKKTFRQENWVDDLVAACAALARQDENSDQWLKAMRIYSDLGAIEPSKPEWKDKLKLATRRIRLLAMYTPDAIKSIQESEMKDREEVDRILRPATQPAPATKPATKPVPDDEKAEDFRVDWHETLKGIDFRMLWDDKTGQGALQDARTNYYRDSNYRDLIVGGLKGMETLVTTKGLDKTFPKLAEEVTRGQFLDVVHSSLDRMKSAADPNDAETVRKVLSDVRTSNRDTIQLPEQVLISEFADGAFGELDPFSNMIWPNDLEEFNKSTQGEFSGVGIQIQSDDDGSLKVVSPLEDSPAYKAGIKAGDIISHINGKNAKGININQAVKKITGPQGTKVTLTIRSPDGTSKDHILTRETIKVGSVKGWSHRPGGGWDYFVDPKDKIGYVRITNFTKTTSDDLGKALEEMSDNGARAAIIDLRYNPGGLLNAATAVVDKFIKEGVIVSTHADRETPNQPTVANAQGDGKCTMPVAVLVNQYSASASEIVSGALKDQKRALIVGERTFGKGSVQMLFPLAGRTAYLKLTTSHYYLPSGKCIHREENSTEWGVDPDVTIEMTPEQARAAIDSRQELDVLRDAATQPAPAPAPADEPRVEGKKAPTTQKDPLSVDPQLSGALLLLRLQLAGAQI